MTDTLNDYNEIFPEDYESFLSNVTAFDASGFKLTTANPLDGETVIHDDSIRNVKFDNEMVFEFGLLEPQNWLEFVINMPYYDGKFEYQNDAFLTSSFYKRMKDYPPEVFERETRRLVQVLNFFITYTYKTIYGENRFFTLNVSLTDAGSFFFEKIRDQVTDSIPKHILAKEIFDDFEFLWSGMDDEMMEKLYKKFKEKHVQHGKTTDLV